MENKNLPLQSVEYRVENEGFIFSIIRFIEDNDANRMSIEEISKIIEIDTLYIHLKIFTYLHIASTLLFPKNLTRYLSNRLILFEIAYQLTYVYDTVRK